MTFIFSFLLGFLIFFLFDQISLRTKPLKRRFWDNPVTFFGYHIHHSFLGLIIAVIGVLWFPFLTGFGIGIIVSHTIVDKKLVFIEKANKYGHSRH